MSENAKCYWCGSTPTSREHVPSLCLFPKHRRTNLLSVPSCDLHNDAFKLLDEKMRFYLQAASDNALAIELFNDKTKRGLLKPEGAKLKAKLLKGFSIVKTPAGQMGRLELDFQECLPFFEKVTRGIYYLTRKSPFKGGFCVGFRQNFSTLKSGVISGKLNQLTFDQLESLFASSLAKAGKVSHPEIFRYSYISIVEECREAFVIAMIFYNSFEVLGTLHRDVAR